MALQYLTAEKQATQYYFKVWMDNTKFATTVDDKGNTVTTTNPDPNYIKEYSWSLIPPEGQTDTFYLASIKSEIALLVDYELSQIQLQQTQQPTPLAGF